MIRLPFLARRRYRTNLLLLHTPGFQDVSDWWSVKSMIEARAPDIQVRIDSNTRPSRRIARWQARRPSLVFSPYRLVAYEPPGGTVYAGRDLGKLEELRRLAAAGSPVPRTELFRPGFDLDPREWGAYVIVKPVDGMQGRDVRLVRTIEAKRRHAELSDGGRRQLIVQPFIDHVDEEGRPHAYRVLTMFGKPLYQSRWRWAEARRPLAEIAAGAGGPIASNAQGVARSGGLALVPDVLELARRVAGALPEIPCLGQDIIRETGSGTLFVMETNPGGFTWHLSSKHSRRPGYDRDFARSKYEQFDALRVVAETLIEKTRAEAS
jgi:hypothetical protein